MGKFEVFKGTDGKYYFRLKAANGEIIAHSQAYTSKQGAVDGANAVKRIAPTAPIVDLVL